MNRKRMITVVGVVLGLLLGLYLYMFVSLNFTSPPAGGGGGVYNPETGKFQNLDDFDK